MTFWLGRLFARTATIAICLLAPISRVGEKPPNCKMRWTACDLKNTIPRVSKASGSAFVESCFSVQLANVLVVESWQF